MILERGQRGGLGRSQPSRRGGSGRLGGSGVPGVPGVPGVDGKIARLLAELSVYHRWQNRPLTRSLRQTLADLDDQTLMTLAADALHRLESRSKSDG